MVNQTFTSSPFRWHQKVFAVIAIFCSMFMFVAFSGSYSTTMDWVDIQLGRNEMRQSEGLKWLRAAIGSGVEVNAQLAVVDVANRTWQAIHDGLVGALSSILNSILGTLQQVFSALKDKVQEISSLFASLGGQAGNISLSIQSVVWPQILDRFNPLELVDGLLGPSIPEQARNTMADAVARYQFASVANATADPSAPPTVQTSQADLQQAANDIATTANAACNKDSELRRIQFSRIFGPAGNNKGCGNDVINEVAQASAQAADVVEEAQTNLETRAPADCQIAYADLSTSSFSGGTNLAGIQSRVTNQFIQSDFLNSVVSFSDSTEIKVLSPDECDALQGSTDIVLAGTAVTPPSNSGAVGFAAVIQTFVDSIVGLINDLISSVIDIAKNAFNAVFNAFPRIFGEGFNSLVGNFSSVIQTNLSGISQLLVGYENTIKDTDFASEIPSTSDIVKPKYS